MAFWMPKAQGLDTPAGKSLTGFLPMEIQKIRYIREIVFGKI